MPAVVLIDVDKFRSVNATYGLVVGDSLLLTLARRLQTPSRAPGHAGADLAATSSR